MCSQNVYSEVIVSHFKKPRNKGRLTRETTFETGYNPKCGDVIHLSILMGDDDFIEDIMFDGKGCMICLASASILTHQVKRVPVGDVFNLIREVEKISKKDHVTEANLPPDIKALSSIQRYPTRKQCVMLAWQTLESALQKRNS
ncbi:MAG: SUF system NifU family Fe-S cluster assembly protein [Balneolales bacterium]